MFALSSESKSYCSSTYVRQLTLVCAVHLPPFLTLLFDFDLANKRYNRTGYITPDGYEPSDDYIVLLPDSFSTTCRRFRLSTLSATDSNAWRFHMLMFWNSQVALDLKHLLVCCVFAEKIRIDMEPTYSSRSRQCGYLRKNAFHTFPEHHCRRQRGWFGPRILFSLKPATS